MPAKYPKNAVILKDDNLKMPWVARQFILQDQSFFHGAVIEYTGALEDGTEYNTAVMFHENGRASVLYNNRGKVKSFTDTMSLVRSVAAENKTHIEDTGQSGVSLVNQRGVYLIVENYYLEDDLRPDLPLSKEDLEDVVARVNDLRPYTDYSFVVVGAEDEEDMDMEWPS